ncbi:uncharacterized protein LY89DRAFT_718530 [Mollisia scopiformis]|uniref:Uncharacterized protein n=1 Tax=Mollisia scopiformis TaxID=149040 RepID=A0A194X9G7_MOLSC|nr:uncharacterized protein LY89DRAFT_718530 [Mollisia scopiformis]KUJ16769.1 hypothetical protein LY89DRAFT_718530 [Mollisia scopiformis]
MRSELEQLDLQPTFAQLQQQLTAFNHNMTACIVNASLRNDTDELAPLVNPQTNAPVMNFPVNSAALSGLSWPQKRAIGISLAMNDPGVNPNAAAKSTFFTQLRVKIGLRPRPA